ncbi:SAF domain-containing protein [Alicyclobacillus acidocaldarius]|uniref:SAF domain protein n=1 Tax=Alicyclobacillus acidocaldarius subsp. acidocaldarius (strain ATCC 27009 / DSM 446 / BCRC 14685 / JCM 5260 / KCTC 1825 / NBRC 15652 / NCIMB 11725 / NRRL B-14509 / 104-IA) TaxID=521098 RepID=C8WSX1_ALIAD|nr:SAF domain-containing protein [Alicyclobacillus acidocaldarius]ACV57627.1 SAF domain protein [Alicyclobacillus acidocaldarius subsp. acidocaldarius DSM 446]
MRKSGKSARVNVRPGTAWIAGLAALGLVTAFVMDRVATHKVPMATAYVASHDLTVGETIGAKDVTRTVVPVSTLPPGALTASPIGKTVTAPVYQGQVLVGGDLGHMGGVNGVMRLYGMQTRAYPLTLSTQSVPMTDISVGQAVDVIAQMPSPNGAGNVTKLVAQNAPVIAVATAQDVILVGVTDSEALQMANATKLYVALSPETPWVPAETATTTTQSSTTIPTNNTGNGTVNPPSAGGTTNSTSVASSGSSKTAAKPKGVKRP